MYVHMYISLTIVPTTASSRCDPLKYAMQAFRSLRSKYIEIYSNFSLLLLIYFDRVKWIFFASSPFVILRRNLKLRLSPPNWCSEQQQQRVCIVFMPNAGIVTIYPGVWTFVHIFVTHMFMCLLSQPSYTFQNF